jgi:hypothetical protein
MIADQKQKRPPKGVPSTAKKLAIKSLFPVVWARLATASRREERGGTNRKMSDGFHRALFRFRLVPRCHCISPGGARAIIGQRWARSLMKKNTRTYLT